jgi:hypothetical protein
MAERLLHLMVNRKQRARKGLAPDITIKGMPPVTLLRQVAISFPFLFFPRELLCIGIKAFWLDSN